MILIKSYDVKKFTLNLKNSGIKVRFMHKMVRQIVDNVNKFTGFFGTRQISSTTYEKKDSEKNEVLKTQVVEALNSEENEVLEASEKIKEILKKQDDYMNSGKPLVSSTKADVKNDLEAQKLDFTESFWKQFPFHPQIIFGGLIEGSLSLTHKIPDSDYQMKKRFLITESCVLEKNNGEIQYCVIKLFYNNYYNSSITGQKPISNLGGYNWIITNELFNSPNEALNEKNIAAVLEIIERHNKKLSINVISIKGKIQELKMILKYENNQKQKEQELKKQDPEYIKQQTIKEVTKSKEEKQLELFKNSTKTIEEWKKNSAHNNTDDEI